MKKNQAIVNALIVTAIILIVGIALAYSYAYFSPIIIGNDTNTETRINSGTFNVDFTSSRYINASNLIPINNSEHAAKAEHTDFAVSLSNSIAAKYDIYLKGISISNNLKTGDFCWELLENNVVINSGNFLNIGTSTQIKLNTNIIQLSSGTKNYIFRLWINNTSANQNSLIGGTFSGKIKIVSTNQ